MLFLVHCKRQKCQFVFVVMVRSSLLSLPCFIPKVILFGLGVKTTHVESANHILLHRIHLQKISSFTSIKKLFNFTCLYALVV